MTRDLILCPRCNSEYTDYYHVQTFDRTEDAQSGVHTSVVNSVVTVDGIMTGNPSPRRHGVRLAFMCETCADVFTVALYQHKGNTFIDTNYEATS